MELKKVTEPYKRVKVLVKRFSKSDFDILDSWLKKREALASIEELPAIGYVAYSLLDNNPVAMGFLRQAEGIGFIEGMATNPDASSADRNEAMDTIMTHLTYFAKRYGMKSLVAYSTDDGIIKRAERLGFKTQSHIMFSKDLGE